MDDQLLLKSPRLRLNENNLVTAMVGPIDRSLTRRYSWPPVLSVSSPDVDAGLSGLYQRPKLVSHKTMPLKQVNEDETDVVAEEDNSHAMVESSAPPLKDVRNYPSIITSDSDIDAHSAHEIAPSIADKKEGFRSAVRHRWKQVAGWKPFKSPKMSQKRSHSNIDEVLELDATPRPVQDTEHRGRGQSVERGQKHVPTNPLGSSRLAAPSVCDSGVHVPPGNRRLHSTERHSRERHLCRQSSIGRMPDNTNTAESSTRPAMNAPEPSSRLRQQHSSYTEEQDITVPVHRHHHSDHQHGTSEHHHHHHHQHLDHAHAMTATSAKGKERAEQPGKLEHSAHELSQVPAPHAGRRRSRTMESAAAPSNPGQRTTHRHICKFCRGEGAARAPALSPVASSRASLRSPTGARPDPHTHEHSLDPQAQGRALSPRRDLEAGTRPVHQEPPVNYAYYNTNPARLGKSKQKTIQAPGGLTFTVYEGQTSFSSRYNSVWYDKKRWKRKALQKLQKGRSPRGRSTSDEGALADDEAGDDEDEEDGEEEEPDADDEAYRQRPEGRYLMGVRESVTLKMPMGGTRA